MSREKLYTQNLMKRIKFICRKCNSEMVYRRNHKRITIECKNCDYYFVISGNVVTKYTNIVYWCRNNNKKL